MKNSDYAKVYVIFALRIWYYDKYACAVKDTEQNAFFLNFEKAEKHVLENVMDITDDGKYNYACIFSYDTGKMRGATKPHDLHVYKNISNNKFEEIADTEIFFHLVKKYFHVT